MTIGGLQITAPRSDYDPYTDENLLDPWPGYREMRAAGPAVWLNKYQMFALARYSSARRALEDSESFPSGRGVMMNDDMNQMLIGNVLCSDGKQHDILRGVIGRPLTARATQPLLGEFTAQAEDVVQAIVAKGTFDAVPELAQHIPVSVVSGAIGLPEKGRERLLAWAKAVFNCIGPMNDRTVQSFPVLNEMMEYAASETVRGKLKPGSWAEGIVDAADRGEVPRAACPALMVDYLAPSLDTTISAMSSAVWLFAQHPGQWDLIREDPSLIRGAINEVLRCESPIQGSFTRFAGRDVDLDGVLLPAGSRAIIFYGSANRDERKFAAPDRFDVRRGANDQLAFGAGPHACVGMHLARLEMRALFTALAKHVQRFEVVQAERLVHNTLRGFSHLRVKVS
jgi:cytochrome P450